MATRLTEGSIHLAIRRHLHDDGWLLIAGQFPGGSDDDLPTLYIVDPAMARDNSPDPRRHSEGKLVPDVVALRGRTLLILEAKPRYSAEDRAKLISLLEERSADLLAALREFADRRGCAQLLPVETLKLVPAQAFAATARAPADEQVAHFLVEDLTRVRCRWPAHLEAPQG